MGNTVALWSSIQSFLQTSELQFCNYLIWRELQNQSRFLAAFKCHQFANVAIKMLEMLVENYVSLDSNLDCKVSLHSLGSYFIWINIFACVCIDNVKCCKDGHESAPISSWEWFFSVVLIYNCFLSLLRETVAFRNLLLRKNGKDWKGNYYPPSKKMLGIPNALYKRFF